MITKSPVFFFIIAAIAFFPLSAAAQKHSKKNKFDQAVETGDSAAVATMTAPPDSKKKSKKTAKSWEPKIIIPDTTAEEMPIPEPTGLVSDFGNVLTQGQEDTLTALIKTFHDSTKDEIMIVAWDTLHLVPEDMDAYIHKIAGDWQIGEENRTNGIIIAYSVQLRKIRIENVTGGLTDKETWEIVHKVMLPYFANKNYYGGTLAGLTAVIKKLNASAE